jgi:AcrR family transcriptional regulator
MDLFAERGFGGTSVGDIEERAGLTRRGGSFYRHFRTKADVLEAVLDAHIASSESHRAAFDLLPFGDLRAELLVVCQWLLESLDSHRSLFDVMARDGERFPKLRDRFRDELIDPAYRAAVAFTARWAEKTGHPSADPEASAVILIGAAEHYRRMQRNYGRAPLNVDDLRFVQTWVRYCYELMTGTPYE